LAATPASGAVSLRIMDTDIQLWLCTEPMFSLHAYYNYPWCVATIKAICMTKVCNSIYRVDLELVAADAKQLTAMQTKINQWITTGQLVKFKTSVVGDKILFEICRKKAE
jgi:hypothetical protein